MPYVKKQLRELVDHKIDDLVVVLREQDQYSNGRDTKGLTNYTITRILIGVFGKDYEHDRKSYSLINDAIGVLGCVGLEFYRRLAAPYEDEKIKENGEVYDV